MNGPAPHLASSRAVVRGGVFNILGYIASAAYMFLIVPVALAHLGQEHYGLWMTVVAVTAYLALTDFGVSTSFVKYIAGYVTTGDFRSATRVVHLGLLFYGVVSIVLCVLAMALYAPVFVLLRIPAEQLVLARDALLLILVTFAMTSLGSVLTNALAAVQRLDVVNIASTAALAVKFGAILAALHAGWGLRGLLGADLTVTVAVIPVMLILTKRHMPYLSLRWQGYDHALMKTMLGFGAQLQVSRIADIVSANFDKLLLARFAGLPVVATYDFGAKPAGRLRQMPATGIMSLVAAVSSLDAQQNHERIRAALVRSTRYLAILSAPLFGYCAFFAGPLITAWLGEEHVVAAMTLRIFCPAFFISSVVSALSTIGIGRGEPQYQMRAMLMQTVINIILSTVLILEFGYYGAVTGTALATLAGALLFFSIYGSRLVHGPLRLLFSLVSRPTACAVAAGLLSWAAFWAAEVFLGRGGRLAGIALLAGAAFLYACVYSCLLVWSRTLTGDDAGFLKGVLPHRISALLEHMTRQHTT